MARGILTLKQRYPPLHHREIVRIIERQYGYHTNHHTVAKFLERYPIPNFENAYQARWTVVQMFYKGWNKSVYTSHAVMLRVLFRRLK